MPNNKQVGEQYEICAQYRCKTYHDKTIYILYSICLKGLNINHTLSLIFLTHHKNNANHHHREPRSIQEDHICSFLDSGQGRLTPAGQTCDTAPSGHALQGHVNPAMSLGQPFDSSSPVITNEVRLRLRQNLFSLHQESIIKYHYFGV